MLFSTGFLLRLIQSRLRHADVESIKYLRNVQNNIISEIALKFMVYSENDRGCVRKLHIHYLEIFVIQKLRFDHVNITG